MEKSMNDDTQHQDVALADKPEVTSTDVISTNTPHQNDDAPENKCSDISLTEEDIVAGLRKVYDPELPVNIYDLGLIYKIIISDDNHVHIHMTLTTPGCPVAQTFPTMVSTEVRQVPGVSDASVEIVWDPPWTQERMSEAARLELGML